MSALKTRPPTGRIPWPLILIEGGEKAGKSWAIAELSASPKVGQTYWIDLGEGSADEYGAVPGARYLVVEHDGTFAAILAAVEAIRAEAAKVPPGQPPIVLGIDSMTAEWDLLKGQADAKARQRLAKKGRAVPDDAEPQISMDLWNEANAKHRRLMTLLMTFPGIVVMAARGKEVATLDGAGRPVEGSKEYRVEGQKNLAFDASVWIRVSRDHPPVVVGARSVHAGVRPGVDKPRPVPGLTLEKVVFDVLRCNPADAQVRDLVEPQPVEPEEPAVEMMNDDQRKRLFAQFGEADLSDREKGLAFINEVIAPAMVESTKQLTKVQASAVIDRLGRFIAQNTPPEPTRDDEGADPGTPATPQQNTAFEQFLEQIKAAESAARLVTLGQLVNDARGGRRITRIHHDRLVRAAAARQAKFEQAVPA